jgi:signal transduction histidine kinase
MTLRRYLAILVLAGLLPLVVLTGLVTMSLARQQRAAVERGLSDTVAALATAVENDLRASIKSLQTLATSKRLDEDDLPAFYEEAARVRDLHRWSTIGLIDARGDHQLNVAQPPGSALPDLRDREYFKHVMATGRPYVSDLLRGRVTGTVDLGVAVPVVRDGRTRYVLFAGVDPAGFNAVFEAQRLPPHSIASLVSRDGMFIARSPDHDRFVGAAPPPAYLERIRASPHGSIHSADLDGMERDVAYTRMALTGWTVGFGVPTETLNGPVRRVAWTGAVVGAGIVIGAVALVAVFAGRMATSIASLGASASAVGRGEPIAGSSPLPIAELEQMRRSLNDADALLQQRARELAELLAREQAARAGAEAASSAKDHFLAMLGHELRNPLGAISSATAVLGLAGKNPDAAERARAVIGRQVRHLSRLVDDLLDVSRVTTGKIALDREPVDLADLVMNVLSTHRASGRLDQHRVSADVSSAWVNADETRVEQIVSNLLGNALKYTPAGGSVGVRVEAQDDQAVLEVADTGVGIPPELIGNVFDLFVQGERAPDRVQGGLGLGLTLVRALVSMHGGTVEARSAGAGKGAVFTVRLPRIAAPTPPAPAGAPRPRAAVRRRVLVIEDNEDARLMLRTMLELAGHEVHESADGPSGVAMAAAVAPDIALIDVGLPGLDGYEVARRIRAGRHGPSMRLIAVTGYGQAEDRRRALDAGFDAHLSKPVSQDRLAELIA